MLEIKHKLNEHKGEFFIGEDNHHLAEMSYSWAGDDKIIIDHTVVSDDLRGQGVGRKLLDNVIELAREKHVKIIPLCPFSKAEFAKDLSIHDVLKD